MHFTTIFEYCAKLSYSQFMSRSSSETQGFKGDGKGREKLRAGKKERGGEGKGKRKGEALGSFSIQIISRSKSKHH